jgi:hypothetical protein
MSRSKTTGLLAQAASRKRSEKKEAARFAAAEKVTEWEGWLYSDGIQGYNDGYNDGYYAGADALMDYIADNTPDDEELAELEEDELAEIPKMPEYLWTCDEERFATASLDSIMENIADRGYEDFDTADLKGTEELGAAIDAFNEANVGIVSYRPNYKKALILGMNAKGVAPLLARADVETEVEP